MMNEAPQLLSRRQIQWRLCLNFLRYAESATRINFPLSFLTWSQENVFGFLFWSPKS